MAQSASKAITDAVADKARPEADTVRDADRKPAECIALTGIHPGSKVAEMLPGGGYFTRILSKVLGPQGTLYAWLPLPAPNAPPGGRDMSAPIKALMADANYPNIKLANLDPSTPLPEQVDLVWTSLNYHDMRRGNADLGPTNKMVWNALKPGGLYMVIDHAAVKGSGARDLGLHRIDPELVKQEITSAGFKLTVDSDLLKHPADDHTKNSHEVERGHSDQFVFVFQKVG
jgi:predicted methyltransferase